MINVIHAIYPPKAIPDTAIDKFIEFKWSGTPKATDNALKAAHQAKEDAKATQYAIANDIPLVDAKLAVKGTVK